MTHAFAGTGGPAAAQGHCGVPRLLSAAVIALGLIALSPAMPGEFAFAADTPAAKAPDEGQGKPNEEFDIKGLKERLRVLGEAIRNAIDEASRAMKRDEDDLASGKGGLGALAPLMRGRELRAVYGPKGPTLRSVEALLNYRLVLLGNDRLTAGRVYERDGRIIAEIVTRKEKALVARYTIDKRTGVWVPER